MKSNLITKHKWFWGWQDDKEEVWLREMAHQGYHLEKVELFGVYHFRVGEPKDVVYRLDYRSHSQKDKNIYLQLFTDSGWEHVVEMSGWYYFRKEVIPGEDPQIFTDNASKAEKYLRLMSYLVVFIPFITVILNKSIERAPGSVFWTVIQGVQMLLIVIYTYCMVNLYLRYRALKKKRL